MRKPLYKPIKRTKLTLPSLLGCWLCLWPLLLPAAGLSGAERDARIAALLRQARQAVAEDRLTIPSGHNAVSYAQQLLDLEPNHPQALQILRNVVARYNTLGAAALDRAEVLKARELNKAQTYEQRGTRVVQRYDLPNNTLTPLTEGLAAAESTSKPVLTDERVVVRQRLAEIAAGYVALGEAALEQGYVEEARRYQIAAELLVNKTPYGLSPDARLQQLTQRLERAEAERRAVSEQAASREPVFLPAAF
jgi:hypothetical protein